MLRSFLNALSDANDLVVQTAFLSMRVYMDAALLDPGTDCASWKSASGEEGDCYAMAKLTVGERNYFAYAQGDYLLYGESDFNIDFEPVYCKVEPFQTENPEPYGLLEPVYAILSDWKETFREACGRIEKLENVSWEEEGGVPYGEEGYCIANAETGERLFYRKDFYGAVYVGLEYLDEYGSQIAYAQFSPPDESFPAQAFDGSQTVPSGRYQPFVRNLKEYSDKLLGKD